MRGAMPSVVRRVQAQEAALGADASLPFTRAVARSLLKLMATRTSTRSRACTPTAASGESWRSSSTAT